MAMTPSPSSNHVLLTKDGSMPLLPPRPVTRPFSRPVTLSLSFAAGALSPVIIAGLTLLYATIGPRLTLLTDLFIR